MTSRNGQSSAINKLQRASADIFIPDKSSCLGSTGCYTFYKKMRYEAPAEGVTYSFGLNFQGPFLSFCLAINKTPDVKHYYEDGFHLNLTNRWLVDLEWIVDLTGLWRTSQGCVGNK